MDAEGLNKLAFEHVTESISYKPTDILKIGPFEISFIETRHPVPCVAMNITDWEQWVSDKADTRFFEELISFTQDADLLIAECRLYQDQNGEPYGAYE